MILTNERVDAQTALRIGPKVEQVVPSGHEPATALSWRNAYCTP